ncbi:hypothetical protein Tco_1539114 [Tanacetum coccineum]
MPEEWRLSDVIPIFKNKGDAQVCSNYRGIKLLSHTMKLWERVIERMCEEDSVIENPRVICDRNVPLKLKGKFYRAAIRPAMLYGSECWPITKALANRMEVADAKVDSVMREGQLRWFGHVRRRPQSAPVRRVEALVVDGMRRRGRPKLRWEDRVKLDMKEPYSCPRRLYPDRK